VDHAPGAELVLVRLESPIERLAKALVVALLGLLLGVQVVEVAKDSSKP